MLLVVVILVVITAAKAAGLTGRGNHDWGGLSIAQGDIEDRQIRAAALDLDIGTGHPCRAGVGSHDHPVIFGIMAAHQESLIPIAVTQYTVAGAGAAA